MSEGAVIIICASISAVVSIFTAWLALKAKQTAQETHTAVNSRMTEFLETAEKKFRALGELEGAAREKREEQVRRLNPPLQSMGD